MFTTLFAISLLVASSSAVPEINYCGTWSYQCQGDWVSSYPDCGKDPQSPINIVSYEARGWGGKNVVFKNWDKEYNNFTEFIKVEHDGIFYQTSMLDQSRLVVADKQFKFEEAYYHWGTTRSDGSEHSIDGQKFAGEIQYLFIAEQYKCIEEASRFDGGMAVVAFLVEVNDTRINDTEVVRDFMPVIKQIKDGVRALEKKVPGPFANQVLLPGNLDAYQYTGSLSFPPCTINVDWVVFKERLQVTKDFINMNWAMTGLGENIRDLSTNTPTVYNITCTKEEA